MKYIKGFDGLRAISISFVVLNHLGIQSMFPKDSFLYKNYNLFSGTTGVMIFFAISGFLITSLLIREKKTNGKINLKFFFARRFLRLLPPLVVLFAVIGTLMAMRLITPNYLGLTVSFFYLYNFSPYNLHVSELGHTWSLAVEEQFYFFWPFIINGISRLKGTIKVSLVLITTCLIAYYLYPKPIYFHGKPHYLMNYFYADRFFIPACMPIMIGSLASLLLFQFEKTITAAFQEKYLFLILSFLSFFIQIAIPGMPEPLIRFFQSIGITGLLLWIYFNQHTVLVSILEWKPISFIGKISYGIYVYQGLFLRTGPGGKLYIQQFPINIILTVIISILSYYLIEKNVIRYKSKFKV